MANSNLEDISEVMSTYSLKFESDIDSDVICGLCSRVMDNPCITSCGCSYCKRCIDNYLQDMERVCPGNNVDCKLGYLVGGRDVHPDPRTHRVIGQLLAHCPNQHCGTITDVKLLKSHIELCQNVIMMCPFRNSGCTKTYIRSDHMISHLQDECYSHSSMIVNLVDTLRYDMDLMKTNYEERLATQEQAMETLRKDYKSSMNNFQELKECYEKRLNEQETKICVMKEDIINVKSEVEEMKTSINTDKEEMCNIVETINYACIDCLSSINDTNAHISMDETDQNVSVLYEEYRTKIWNMDNEYKTLLKEMKDQILNLDVIKVNNIKLELMENFNEKKIDGKHYGQFLWKVDNFKEKVEDAINGKKEWLDSEPFYSHQVGYKMCLRLYPNGYNKRSGTHLSVYFVLMKGEHDDVLIWPNKHRIELGLMNQCSTQESITYAYDYNSMEKRHKYIFEKPKEGTMNIFGNSSFISLERLKKDEDILRNNTLYIMCWP